MTDAAVTTIVTGVVTITTLVVGFLTLWAKLKYAARKADEAADKVDRVENKIDNNTQITREGTKTAVNTAVIAVTTAAHAKEATDAINKKLNGGIDSAIASAVDPIKVSLAEYAGSVTKLSDKLDTLSDYVHQRHHDLLDTLSAQAGKVNLLLAQLDKDKK